MGKRLIGTGTTDSNGRCTIPYVGTGAGLVNMVAEYEDDEGIIQSKTYETLDCTFYDEGKKGEGHHNDNMWSNLNNNYQVDRGDDYTTLTPTDSGTLNRYTVVNNDIRPLPFVVEFDKPVYSGNTRSAIFVIGSKAIYYEYSGFANASHCKFQANEDGTLEIWFDGEKKPTSNFNPDTSIGVRFQTQQNASEDIIKFANFKIYPI